MKRLVRNRGFLLFVMLAVSLALAGCASEPTPTPTATPTPTPVPTPTVLENIRATIEGARETIQEGRIGELADTVVALVCAVAAGDYAPDLTLESVSDSRMVRLAINTFCATR